MINHVKHDEDFFGIFKLTNGEEVLAKAVVTQDQNESLCFLQDPVTVSYTHLTLPTIYSV